MNDRNSNILNQRFILIRKPQVNGNRQLTGNELPIHDSPLTLLTTHHT